MEERNLNALALPAWIDMAEVRSILAEAVSMPEFSHLERYFQASISAMDVSEELTAVKLFEDTLTSLIKQLETPTTGEQTRLIATVREYAVRCENTVNMLVGTQPEVPKVMHFVWVGGSEFGAIQRDYMNIWRQVMVPEGHRFNLWYDSDALLAFEMNRVIHESARVHAMEAGGATVTKPAELAGMIEDRARVLKWQMAEHLAQPQWAGKADEARIDLMVRAYGKDKDVLTAFRQKCLDSHLAMVDDNTRLRDVRDTFQSHFLWDVYQREVAMRGNFAAASDVVRLQALESEGGRYSDLDYLPPLARPLGGVDISKFGESAKIGVLQLLLNQNAELMPGRDAKRYEDLTGKIPEEHQEALRKFAESKPPVHDIFVLPQDNRAAMDGMRLAHATSGDMNSHIIAHPKSGAVQDTLQLIRFNYDCLLEVERRLFALGSDLGDIRVADGVIFDVVHERYAQRSFQSHSRIEVIQKAAQGISTYYMDGIRPEARGTIAMTGPGATILGLGEHGEMHLSPSGAATIRVGMQLKEGFNDLTEEDRISGWTVNDNPQEWLQQEQEKWTAGRYKTRYAGDLAELLKGQALTFEKGWPVIEGRPVLDTPLLQRWVDESGEAFVRAMTDKLSGEVRLQGRLRVSFEERQRIRAQAPVELPSSIGAQPLGNFNELFARIAYGSLPLNQLSPAHRVYLGGLFGAQTLDDAGFADTWQRSRELAQNTVERGLAQRYLAIEQALLSQNSPAFAAGFAEGQARFEVSAQNAKTLKALAFTQPLSVRAWGEHIARIRLQTEHELRIQVLDRSASVLERFVAAGASSAKMMPQGLLIRAEGDPGRHCYPLVLTLAAALSKGASAVDAMIARVANANLDPNANDSHVFLRTLDELRTVAMVETGTPAGQLRLDQLLRTLEDSASTRTLMVNTDNHSMLIAKVVDGASSSYRFYDPNFGIFGFTEAQALRRGLQQFLGDPGISGLYGISPSVDATYHVLDLNGSRIAERSLPSHVAVSALLEHAPLSGDTAVTPWAHHAALRARSLSENARLGQGLADLEGQNWARQLDEVTSRLRLENSLGREFIPMIETAQTNAAGQVTVSMVNVKNSQTVMSVTTADTRLIRIKSYLRERFLALGQPAEASPVNTLNAGFAIQSLMLALHQREGALSADNAPLALSVRLHSYVVYAQMIHGVVSDVVGVIRLVREALRNEKVIAATTSSVVGRALGRAVGEGIGHLLAVASVGFDIYELANADDPAQIARIGTQLFFDSVGLVLGVGGLAVGGTAGAFAGAVAVPLAGIGFGVSALVNNYSSILLKSQSVGKYFYRLKSAYEDGGHLVFNGVLWPRPEVVTTTIELRRRNIQFDTHKLFPSRRNGPGLPDYVVDRSRGIDLRDNWGLLDFALIDGGIDPNTDQPGDEVITRVVLPSTPKRHYGFEYQLLPGAVNRHDKGFDEARELEFDGRGNRQFYFTPWTPFEYIVYKLLPVYEPTQISVHLDKVVTSLSVWPILAECHGLVSYDIEGVGGQCSLTLIPGIASVQLTTLKGSGAMRWMIGAAWVNERSVVVGDSTLKVGGIEVTVEAGNEIYLLLEGGQVFQVDRAKRQLVLTQLNISDKTDLAALREQLAKLGDDHRIPTPYLPLQHFTAPFSDPAAPVRTRAFYDVAKKRTLYARNLPAAVREELQLGTVVGDHVYFYHREHTSIWRVDVSTGLVNRRYRLLNPQSGSTLIACESAGSTVRVVQQVTGNNGQSYNLVYLVQGDQIHMSAVSTMVSDADQEDPYWYAWNDFLALFSLSDVYADATPNMASDVKQWQPPLYLALQAHLKTRIYTSWLRIRDNWMIVSADPVADNAVLLMPETDQHDSFLIYTISLGRLRRGTRGEGDRITVETVLDGIKSLTAQGRSYLVVTDSGLMFDARGSGTVELCGVNLTWLEKQANWLSELALLAEQYQVAGIEVTGLTTSRGSALVGWYQDKRLLLVDAQSDQGLRFLATTPDQRYAWLFAPTTGQLYRQAYLDNEQLSAAFAQGTRLLSGHPLAAAQREWSEWTFAEVELHGSGLRGVTRDGIQLDLQYGLQARIVGVTEKWLRANAATFDPRHDRARAALKTLVSQHPHHPNVSIGNRFSRDWYVSDIDEVVGVSGSKLDMRLLGVRNLGVGNKTMALVHEVPTELTYNSSKVVWVQPSFARREGDVLTLRLQGSFTDLEPLLPDGVTQLVLGTGSDSLSCRVSLAVWQRLECLVLDASGRSSDGAAGPSTTLIMDVGPQDLWRVDQVDGQLLFTDPDSGHSLVLSEVESADPASRSQVSLGLHVLGETRTVSLEQLIGALSVGQVDSLAALVRRINPK